MIQKDLSMSHLRDLIWHIETLRFKHYQMWMKCLNLKSQKVRTNLLFWILNQSLKKQNLSLNN